MRKSLVIQLASLLIAAAIFVLGSSFPASSGSEGACPLTAQTARRQSAAQTAPPSARDSAGQPIVRQAPLVRLLAASGRANPLRFSWTASASILARPVPSVRRPTAPVRLAKTGTMRPRLAKIGRNARAAWSARRPTVNARLIPCCRTERANSAKVAKS